MDDGRSCLVWGCAAKGRDARETAERVARELGRELSDDELVEVAREHAAALESIAKQFP